MPVDEILLKYFVRLKISTAYIYMMLTLTSETNPQVLSSFPYLFPFSLQSFPKAV